MCCDLISSPPSLFPRTSSAPHAFQKPMDLLGTLMRDGFGLDLWLGLIFFNCLINVCFVTLKRGAISCGLRFAVSVYWGEVEKKQDKGKQQAS